MFSVYRIIEKWEWGKTKTIKTVHIFFLEIYHFLKNNVKIRTGIKERNGPGKKCSLLYFAMKRFTANVTCFIIENAFFLDFFKSQKLQELHSCFAFGF
jgi:hypothetical protein